MKSQVRNIHALRILEKLGFIVLHDDTGTYKQTPTGIIQVWYILGASYTEFGRFRVEQIKEHWYVFKT